MTIAWPKWTSCFHSRSSISLPASASSFLRSSPPFMSVAIFSISSARSALTLRFASSVSGTFIIRPNAASASLSLPR